MRCDITTWRPALLILVAAALGVGACSQPERLDTPETRDERLKLPPDLVSARTDDTMRIPVLSGDTDDGDGSGASRPVLPDAVGVTLQRANGMRWLTVDAEPRQVYRWAGRYLERLGIEAGRRAPELGILETEWIYYGAPVTRGVFAPVVQEAEAAEVADRYLMRLERGDSAGTTDVYVAHRRIQRGDADDWRQAVSEPFYEAEFLRGFMLYLGVTEPDSLQRVRRTAGDGGGARLVRLDSGQTALSLDSGVETGWRRVNRALDRAGFTVVSRDSGRREFVVRYDPEASTRESDDEDDTELPRYRLTLQRQGGGAVVLAEALEERPGEGASDIAERILALVREQM